MTLTVTGIEETVLEMDRTGKRIGKYSVDTVRSYARKMIKSAKEYAYKRDGYLENSIEEFQEEKGTNGRITVVWGVNKRKLGPGYKRYGERYDIPLEHGDKKLGEKSQQKAEETGVDVGPQFLSRAVWDWEEKLIRELKSQVKKV